MSKQDIPLIGPILNRILGTRNERFVKRYVRRVEAINALEPQIRPLTDAQLRARLADFRRQADANTDFETIIPQAFAVAREAMDRAVGIRNVLNPQHAPAFPADQLAPEHRAVYDRLLQQAQAAAPVPPEGEYAGGNEPVPGWRQVEIPPAFYDAVRALFPESRPPFRARPFDVQLIGAMVLFDGRTAEMRTGEGKTIVAPLACFLAAIQRLKVHVVTVNDYLVQRDRDWTFPYFHAVGLTVGAIHPAHMQGEDVKRKMYRCDVVYGTTAEFGFDYLRDNMKRSAEQQVQRLRQFAIVDEVDSVLIDEARTPLIISGPAHEDRPRYDLADQLARHLVQKQQPWQQADERLEACKRLAKGLEGDIRNARDKAKVPELQARLAEARAQLPALEAEKKKHTQFFELMLERKACYLTHDGIAEAQRAAGVGSFYVGKNTDLPHLLEQALRAHAVYQRDRDYIVAPMENPQTGRVEPSIVIVDVSTGRPMVGRQWSDGLHQACECKEGVPIKQETQTVASITIQNFFKMYKRLAGMTGTADTEAQEFHDIYRLDVVSIPTNKPVARRDYDDLVFLSGKDKWAFIVDEIKAFHDAGRPVLVGTTSVEKSETLSKMLTQKHGIRHEVLNAKQHEREAHIVEHAGELGQVMIATNMAGRGTDIKLAPITRAQLLDHWLRRAICPREVTLESSQEQLREGVYRKVAPAELGLPRREVEQMPFPDLELRLLRHWALHHTWMTQNAIDRADAEQLRRGLDQTGRFLLHRLRWFASIEDLGGLHVIGTERHESRRIDNQLRGRSGRQGDKGSSRFFISLDDELMKLFAGETTMRVLARLGMKEGDAIEHPILSKSVERAQRKVEERNFQIRKNILEYDEVKEHQRQKFYGLRQRVLEGRDLKGLIFGYVREAVDDAVAEFLDRDYPFISAAEFARQKTDAAIAFTRLRGLERDELEKRVREDAREELHQMIDVTLGEYIADDRRDSDRPGVDFDAPGLIKWSADRFGVEFSPAELEQAGPDARALVARRLTDAIDARLETADLSGLQEFVQPGYGARELCLWANSKFSLDLDPAVIVRTAEEDRPAVARAIIEEAEKLYAKREAEYPVDFMMEMTLALARQNPQAAMGQLAQWASERFGVNWTDATIRGMPPAKCRDELIRLNQQFIAEGRLAKAVADAQACPDDDALERHLQDRYRLDLPDTMRRLSGEERQQAIRGRVESALRRELVFFERSMLLDVLDDLWRGHLHRMDQLQDGIGFRHVSQLDPRIEFKREGSRLFTEFMQSIRDRVTDLVFKLRPSAQFMAPPPAAPAPQAAAAATTPSPVAPAARSIPGAIPTASPSPAPVPRPAPLPTPRPVAPAAPQPPANTTNTSTTPTNAPAPTNPTPANAPAPTTPPAPAVGPGGVIRLGMNPANGTGPAQRPMPAPPPGGNYYGSPPAPSTPPRQP